MKVKEESEKADFKLNIQKTKIMVSSPITSWQIDGETMETVTDYFLGLQNHCRWWLQSWIKRHLLLGRKAMTNLDSILKSRYYFVNKGPYNQSYSFSSSHVWMWELDYKESWALKNWCFWTVVLERLSRVPGTASRPNQSILKENNSEYSSEGLMLKLQYFGHLNVKSQLTGKDPDAGKDWRQEEKGKTEDEMVGWHHQLNGHESEQAPGDGKVQGSLACCSSWGCEESDMTERLNNPVLYSRTPSMDRGAWQAPVHGVGKSRTLLSE